MVTMKLTKASKLKMNFSQILKQLKIEYESLPLSKCDERTLYVTISLQFNNTKTVCDLIYLMDKPRLFGAISLNKQYDLVKDFFKTHFNYDLLYSDELQLAHQFMYTANFKQSLLQFSNKYPKYTRLE